MEIMKADRQHKWAHETAAPDMAGITVSRSALLVVNLPFRMESFITTQRVTHGAF